jgi:hypothetical protein
VELKGRAVRMERRGRGRLTSLADRESSASTGQWAGQGQNQHGSMLTITDDSSHQVHGTFRTALGDSGFAGQDAEVTGIRVGDCLSFASKD